MLSYKIDSIQFFLLTDSPFLAISYYLYYLNKFLYLPFSPFDQSSSLTELSHIPTTQIQNISGFL